MPRTRVAPTSSKAAGGESHRLRVGSILRRREQLIAEVQGIATIDGCGESAKKAQQLLTRWWAKADWKAREELLRVAEWIIRVEAKA